MISGRSGPYTGGFPAGLLNPRKKTPSGPRIGLAYRLGTGTILRGGYSITYNPASYATIARQLVAQPPFADTETVLGTPSSPLTLANGLVSSTSATTNNYGVDKDYALGMIQTWNATLTRNLSQSWAVIVGYTGVKGATSIFSVRPIAGRQVSSFPPFSRSPGSRLRATRFCKAGTFSCSGVSRTV